MEEGNFKFKGLSIVILLITLSSIVTADDQFYLIWEDFFPSCAVSSEEYNPIRCGCEFLIPNLHIGMIGSMLQKIIFSIFGLLGAIFDTTTDVGNRFYDYVSWDFTKLAYCLEHELLQFDQCVKVGYTPEPIEHLKPEVGDFPDILGRFINWFWGVITAFLVIILILTIEFIKDYLLLATALLLWMTVLKELHIYNGSPSAVWGFYLGIVVIAIMFFGSIWLIGSDLGLYKPLIII